MSRFAPRPRRPEHLPGLPFLLLTVAACLPLALLFSVVASLVLMWMFVPEIIFSLGSTMAATVRTRLSSTPR